MEKPSGDRDRDGLFVRVIYILVGLALGYGAATVVLLIVLDADDQVVTRFMSSFGVIFAGLLGLCSGYLIGRQASSKQ